MSLKYQDIETLFFLTFANGEFGPFVNFLVSSILGFVINLDKLSEKNYDSFLWMGLNCFKVTEPLRRDSLLFTTKSPEFLAGDRPWKDERLS